MTNTFHLKNVGNNIGLQKLRYKFLALQINVKHCLVIMLCEKAVFYGNVGNRNRGAVLVLLSANS